MKLLAAALIFFASSFQARACSPLSLIAMENGADAIVVGLYTDSERPGEGSLVVRRRTKGRLPRVVQIRWNQDLEDDGVNCPEWRPTWKKAKGRFYLSQNSDGTFSVIMADTKKAKE